MIEGWAEELTFIFVCFVSGIALVLVLDRKGRGWFLVACFFLVIICVFVMNLIGPPW